LTLGTLRHWRSPGAALLLGASTPLAFAPTGFWWLIPLTLAPLLWRVGLRPAAPRFALRLGWLWGFGLFFLGVGWIQVSLSVYGELPWLLGWAAVALLAGFLSLFPAAALWALARLGQSSPVWVRLLLLAPALWTVSEWLRGWVFTGFPWLSLGDSQAPDGWLAPLAPVVGHFGLSGLLVLASGLLVLVAQAICRRQRTAALASVAALLGLAMVGPVMRDLEWSRPTGVPLSVELLQPDVAQAVKWDPAFAGRIVAQVTRQTAVTRAHWVILPETALPFFLSDLKPDVLERLTHGVRVRGGELLIGLPTADDRGYRNSVVSLGHTGAPTYHKHHLVPFGEYVPWGFRWFVEAVAIPMSDFSPGEPTPPPMALSGQRIAFMICYEDIFASEVARRAADATVLVNQTNDAWFGRTAASWQHAQQSQMRALENARPLLRSTNNGITLAADHRGRVLAALPPFTPGTLAATLQGRTGTTPYQRWGDGLVLGVSTLVLLLVAGWRRLTTRRQ